MLESLTALEFEGLATRAFARMPHQELRISRSALDRCVEAHIEHLTRSPSLAAAAADLMVNIVQHAPITSAEGDHSPSVVLAALATEAFCEKNRRTFPMEATPVQNTLRLLEATERDPAFLVGRIALILKEVLPDDVPSRQMALYTLQRGLRAAVGCAQSGLDPKDEVEVRRLADALLAHLRELGFATQEVVVHHNGEPNPLCNATLNVDLFVALHPFPSTRLGSQVRGVTGLLSPVLVLVPTDVRQVTCLFKSLEVGNFSVYRYDTAKSAMQAIDEFVGQNGALLEEHAALRVRRDQWHMISFLELREAVLDYLARNVRPQGLSLISTAAAEYTVSSIDAYSDATITRINYLRVRVGLPPLVTHGSADPTSELEALLSSDQLEEFRSQGVQRSIPDEYRPAVLRHAIRHLTLAGSDATLRRLTFTSPEDWIRTYRSVRKIARPNTRKRDPQ